MRIQELADGNPWAADIAVRLQATQPDGEELVEELLDRDITGPLVCVGFKDHCNENTDEFAEAVRTEDGAMFNEIEKYRKKVENR